MKKSLIYIVFILSVHTHALAQTAIGKVIDKKTGTGIPYVSIALVGTNTVTVTNENGDYILPIRSYPAKIRFSHISYSIAEITLLHKQESTNIQLFPASITLKEVIIGPNVPEKLLVAAFKKAKENLGNYSYSKAFYRQLTTINANPSEIYELFYDLKWSAENVQGWRAKQSRFATSLNNIDFTVNNQSFLTFIFSGMLLPKNSNKSIRLETLKDYHVTIDRYIEQTDQQIAVISCRLKRPLKKAMYVNSIYYIGTNNSFIYRLENQIVNLPNNFKDVSSATKSNLPTELSTISTFKSNAGAFPTLESTATRLKVAIVDHKQSHYINVTSLLNIYDSGNDIKKQDFISLNGNINDKRVIKSVAYNADFWRDNLIVKQTALEDAFIKMMESKQAFGTMTNP